MRRRLAYLCLETPREGQGAATHVREIVRGLLASGWQVELFATGCGGASAGTSYLSRIVDYARVQWALYRALGRFDAVYVRAHFAALPLALAARLRAVPVFQEVNGRPADLGVTYRWLRPFLGALAWSYRVQLRHASHVFAVTGGLVEWVRRSVRHTRVTLIPNAADTDLFRPDGPVAPIGGPYVIFVGGLVAWHGIETMLAATRSAQWPRDVRLVVVGDGVERVRVKAAAQSDSTVLWLGLRSYEEVPELLRGAIAALCVIDDPDGRSATGVAPLKLFEALACGLPVIASDLPFQADIVRSHALGIVIPAGSGEALARAVATLAADPEEARAIGRRGAAYARAHGSWSARAGETCSIMARTVDGTALGGRPRAVR
jgi:glycosyltransferase involved in cell wall biosynthesis